eukprot:515308_1
MSNVIITKGYIKKKKMRKKKNRYKKSSAHRDHVKNTREQKENKNMFNLQNFFSISIKTIFTTVTNRPIQLVYIYNKKKKKKKKKNINNKKKKKKTKKKKKKK